MERDGTNGPARATEGADSGLGQESSRRRPRWRRFLAIPSAAAGAAAILIFVLLAVAGEALAGDPYAQIAPPLQGPSMDHLFGTDELGRDILARVVGGTQDALTAAVGAALLASIVGVPLGVIAGYWGGHIDMVIMRVFDVILGLPTLVMALLVLAVFGGGTAILMLAIATAVTPVFGRLARASTLTTLEREFVVAARAMGASNADIMFRTVLRNISTPLIIQFVITASVAIVAAAALNFLGLGSQPPEPTWGGMLSNARAYLDRAPLYGVFPGLALFIAIASFDAIGRGLRSVLGATGSPQTKLQRSA